MKMEFEDALWPVENKLYETVQALSRFSRRGW